MGLKYLKRSDAAAILLVLVSTCLYFTTKYIPDDIKSIDLYFFEIGSFGFPNIAQLVYYSKMKILILTFALVWYFTCKHWWKSAILVIITIELAKLVSSLNSMEIVLDEIDYIKSLPITIPIVLALFLISNRLNAYNLSKELHGALDDEIDSVFHDLNSVRNDKLVQLKQELNLLRKHKSDTDDAEYLKKLKAIRNSYYNI